MTLLRKLLLAWTIELKLLFRMLPSISFKLGHSLLFCSCVNQETILMSFLHLTSISYDISLVSNAVSLQSLQDLIFCIFFHWHIWVPSTTKGLLLVLTLYAWLSQIILSLILFVHEVFCSLLSFYSWSLLRFLVIPVSYGTVFERALPRCNFVHLIRSCMVCKLIDITRISTEFIHDLFSLKESFLSIFDFPGRLSSISLQEAIHVGLAKPVDVSNIRTRHFFSETFLSCRWIIDAYRDAHFRCHSIETMINTAIYMLLLTILSWTKNHVPIVIHLTFTMVDL